MFYTEDSRFDRAVSATIDELDVPVSVTKINARGFVIMTIEVMSSRRGKLDVIVDGELAMPYTIGVPEIPAKVGGVAARYQGPAHDGEPSEVFDGLAIKLSDASLAVSAHVKLRNDPRAPWVEIDVGLYTPRSETRPMIRVGQFGCGSNVSASLLSREFDLTATVLMSDGTTREVTGMADRMSMPAPLPPQPHPKNRRPFHSR